VQRYLRLLDYRAKRDHLLAGLMSGTSLDGVDAALVCVRTDGTGAIEQVTLKHFAYLPYSEELRSLLFSLCSVETARLDRLSLAHYGLAEWYAHAVQLLLGKAKVSADEVDAVCAHGQTVWHMASGGPFPGPMGTVEVRASLQIGDLSTLAERTGIPVVGNFRARDLAAGGQGAPLVPYADYILFRDAKKGRMLQNIGGIANVTVLPAGCGIGQVLAFDTGPGNMVIDEVVRIVTEGRQHCDEAGRLAAGGSVVQPLLERLLDDPFYRLPPPKSTGREVYGTAFARRLAEEARLSGVSGADLIATVTALTACSIAEAYKRFIFPAFRVDEVIVSGGGAHNQTLLRMLKQHLPAEVAVTTAEQFGIPDDAKEAVAFAVLGHETLMGRPSNVPSATGAKKAVPLGNVCW